MHMMIIDQKFIGWTISLAKSMLENSKDRAVCRYLLEPYKLWKTDRQHILLIIDKVPTKIWLEHTKRQIIFWIRSAQEKQELRQPKRERHPSNKETTVAILLKLITQLNERKAIDKISQQLRWTKRHQTNTTGPQTQIKKFQMFKVSMIFIKSESHHQQEEFHYPLLEQMNRIRVQWLNSNLNLNLIRSNTAGKCLHTEEISRTFDLFIINKFNSN